MQRTIVIAADLNGAPLDELKAWLGITRSNEDDVLIELLATSLSMCEAFIGQLPLEATLEESLPPVAGRYQLASRPVQSLASAELLAKNGIRSTLADDDLEIEIDSAGRACFALTSSLVDARAVIVQTVAGIAADWDELPKPLRHGIIRLAAYYYRDRDREEAIAPPASVGALWRPWRTVGLT